MDLAVVQGAVLPQLSLGGLGRKSAAAGAGAGAGPARAFTLDEVPLARIEFGEVTWISRHGVRVVYEGEADFDAAWRPRTARLRRPETSPPADLTLVRQGRDDRWEVRSRIGGGTADGELQLHTSDQGGLRLTGQLQPRNIEAASALQAFNRSAIIAGKASGETLLSASGDTADELVRSLHTTTSFSMGRSTLLGFDLDKAIRSLGQAHAGQTPLDSVTGQIDTQNTPQGMVVTINRLQARSGAFSASGKARIADRRIQAELAVDLVDGVVGVPLTLSGPLEKVQVSVPASALAGAAAGTAVLPGIGTAIGARIGAAIGKLFGSEPEPAARPRPAPGHK
ncbi:AsmA-like C-terminal region-containing protein [Polaromonas hydrogenivorans]|uniref:AsmA-like C-terminal region-containing protein n=1 Tax=Polaromonas hydrogenivorans TaxID=335476 RepID=A0AAU7LRW9_9BURK